MAKDAKDQLGLFEKGILKCMAIEKNREGDVFQWY